MIAKRLAAPNQLNLGPDLSLRKTRKREFLEEMYRVVTWSTLVVALTWPYVLHAPTVHPPFAIETVLRIQLLQYWFSMSDQTMEEALHKIPQYCELAGLDDGTFWLSDETTILHFSKVPSPCHLLETHDLAARILLAWVNELQTSLSLMLRAGTAAGATLIASPSSRMTIVERQ